MQMNYNGYLLARGSLNFLGGSSTIVKGKTGQKHSSRNTVTSKITVSDYMTQWFN